MLDRDSGGSHLGVAEKTERLKCEIDLPESWAGYFEKATGHSFVPDDKRRFFRQDFLTVAVLKYRQTSSLLPRPAEIHKIFTMNVSQTGVAFLHSAQLFPSERMEIWFPEDKLPRSFGKRTKFVVEVARCKRINDRCFEVGGYLRDLCADEILPNR